MEQGGCLPYSCPGDGTGIPPTQTGPGQGPVASSGLPPGYLIPGVASGATPSAIGTTAVRHPLANLTVSR